MSTQPDDPSQTPTVTVYGEPDDHLRLTVLVANALARFEPEAAAVCRRAEKNPWSQRFDAFKQLLRIADLRAARAERPLVRVRDVDALPERQPGGAVRWNDRDFAFERSHLRDALEHEGSIVATDREDPSPDDAPVIERYARALRPIARWALAESLLDEHSLRSYLRLGSPEHVLDVAWDALRPSTQHAAVRLSALRADQRLNGVFGPIPLQGDGAARTMAPTLDSIPRSAVDELCEAGMLIVSPMSTQRVEFPRVVREFLRRHATALAPEELRADHQRIALATQAVSDAATIECHHHAVLASDTRLALETATFYGSDLRTIGTEASLGGRYDDAVKVFRAIVDDFDARDAYAWEYLGYNLWWPHRWNLSRMPEASRDEARRALERACVVDVRSEKNPLFRGRLLGFRGALGEDIADEFHRWLAVFGRRFHRAPERLSWFVKPVRGALLSAGRHDAWATLCERWRDDVVVYGVLMDDVRTHE